MRPTRAAAAAALLISILLAAVAHAQPTRPATTPDPAADQVLRDKGLSRAGTLYLLPGDVASADPARAAAKARYDMETAARKRTVLETDLRRAESAAAGWDRAYRDLNEQYANAADPDVKNRLAAQVNVLASRIREAARFADQREKDLASTPDKRDAYITALLQASDGLEAVQKTYEALTTDADVTTALVKLNDNSRFKYRLGPSPAFTQRLLDLRKQRNTIENTTIKLQMQGGVPTAMVTVNGATTHRMIVDSGASLVSLTADLARQLNITPAPTDPVVHMIIANGQRVDARLVHLKSVQIGPFTAADVEAAVMPDTERTADNLLGGSFLKHFIYRMDLAAGELHLTQLAPTTPTATLAPRPAGTRATTRPAAPRASRASTAS